MNREGMGFGVALPIDGVLRRCRGFRKAERDSGISLPHNAWSAAEHQPFSRARKLLVGRGEVASASASWRWIAEGEFGARIWRILSAAASMVERRWKETN